MTAPETAGPDSPRMAGLHATVTHRDGDEVPWIAVRSQRNADGSHPPAAEGD